MKRVLAVLALLVGFCADAETTSNLLTNQWLDVVSGARGGTSGGPGPAYNYGTNTLIFSWGQYTTSQTIAINNALQGSGVRVGGYNYSWDINNNDQNTGTIIGEVSLRGNNGSVLQNYKYDYSNIRTIGLPENFQRFSGTETFSGAYGIAELSGLTVSWTGRDDKGWAGYYGPRIRNQSLSLNYTVDLCAADPQSSPSCPGFKTYYSISDDGYATVPLPFTFPMYGRSFNTSYFFSNGVVGFLDPTSHGNGFCCSGVDLNTNPGPQWNFAIYALQTDFISSSPDAKFYTQGSPSYMKYTWENVSEYGTNNLNTFSTEIRPSGFIGIKHDSINIRNNPVTIGIAGDVSIGQFSQYYTGLGASLPPTLDLITFAGTETTQTCQTNPLLYPSCPGYTEAICYNNPLFSTTCSGYEAANMSLQCSVNSLYSVQCPGYAAAYLNYMCSQDALYSTACEGYARAYFDQQCTISPLYNEDCPGYTQAYFDRQCELSGLYNRTCPNYAEAYAKKMLLEQQQIASSVSLQRTIEVVDVVGQQMSGGASVDKATAAPPVSVSSSAPAAVVQLVPSPPVATSPVMSTPAPDKKQDVGPSQQTKEADKPSPRQQLNERRQEAARKDAVEKGKGLAEGMGKVADMESQKQVQNVIIGAMGFVQGFDRYSTIKILDSSGYKVFEIYTNQVNVDNRKLGIGLYGPSDRLHKELIEQQYTGEPND